MKIYKKVYASEITESSDINATIKFFDSLVGKELWLYGSYYNSRCACNIDVWFKFTGRYESFDSDPDLAVSYALEVLDDAYLDGHLHYADMYSLTLNWYHIEPTFPIELLTTDEIKEKARDLK